jgi:hypothetical protein
MKKALFFVTILFFAKGFAQELEIAESNDSVNPNLLFSRVYDNDVDTTYVLKPIRFFNVTGSAGFNINHQYRNIFTKTDYSIVRAAVNYHISNFQLNGEIAYYSAFEKTGNSLFRTRLKGAYYLSEENEKQFMRIQLSWNTESWQNNALYPDLIHDFSMIWDISMFPFKSESGKPLIVGGYVFSYRPQLDTFIYGYSARESIIQGDRFFQDFSFGIGYNREIYKGKDRNSIFKLETTVTLISATSPLLVRGAYAVDYQNSHKKNWEIGFILNVNLFRDIKILK